MSSLIDIQSQIEKLQKQAADIKAKEFDKTVLEIRAKMVAFGITLKDLQPSNVKTRAGKLKAKAAGAKKALVKTGKKTGVTVAAKYRGPNGETWSGRGLMPRWLATAVAQGRTKDEFAIRS